MNESEHGHTQYRRAFGKPSKMNPLRLHSSRSPKTASGPCTNPRSQAQFWTRVLHAKGHGCSSWCRRGLISPLEASPTTQQVDRLGARVADGQDRVELACPPKEGFEARTGCEQLMGVIAREALPYT
jgi:hypothetical protein